MASCVVIVVWRGHVLRRAFDSLGDGVAYALLWGGWRRRAGDFAADFMGPDWLRGVVHD